MDRVNVWICFVNSKNIEPSKFKETYLSSNIVRRGGDGDNFYHNNLLFAHSLFSVMESPETTII